MPSPSAPTAPRPQPEDLAPTTIVPAVVAAAPDPVAGNFGHYRVQRKLGAGGMSAVYLAEDTRLRRPVALKVIRPDVSVDPKSRERFLREARAAAAVSHDHVVAVYEVGQVGPTPYLAMQYLKGATLADWQKSGRAVSVAQAARVAREAALGLAAAHAQGLVHRDVKPANLWLEAPNGRVKVLDFGLARSAAGDAKLTAAGVVLGTPAYMSPEQARGVAVDERSDVFSLGTVLYELLSGRLPFAAADTMGALTALAVDDPPPLRDLNPRVPADLAALVARMMAKSPGGRPASAGAVAAELLAAERRLKLAPPAAPPDPAAETARARLTQRDPARPRPAPAATPDRRTWGAAGAGLVGAALLTYLLVPAATGSVELADDALGMVVIEQGGRKIVELGPGMNRATLPAGDYVARPPVPVPFLLAATDQGGPAFALRKNQTVRVRLTQRSVPGAPAGAAGPAAFFPNAAGAGPWGSPPTAIPTRRN